jgi:hypothetical protein
MTVPLPLTSLTIEDSGYQAQAVDLKTTEVNSTHTLSSLSKDLPTDAQ